MTKRRRNVLITTPQRLAEFDQLRTEIISLSRNSHRPFANLIGFIFMPQFTYYIGVGLVGVLIFKSPIIATLSQLWITLFADLFHTHDPELLEKIEMYCNNFLKHHVINPTHLTLEKLLANENPLVGDCYMFLTPVAGNKYSGAKNLLANIILMQIDPKALEHQVSRGISIFQKVYFAVHIAINYAIIRFSLNRILRRAPLGIFSFSSTQSQRGLLKKRFYPISSENEVVSSIEELRPLRDNLASRYSAIRFYARIAIAVSFLMIALLATGYINVNAGADYLFFTCLSFLGASLSYVFHDVQQHRRSKKMKVIFNSNLEKLNAVSTAFNQTSCTFSKEYAVLSLELRDAAGNAGIPIPASHMFYALQDTLIRHGAQILASHKSQISIAAYTPLRSSADDLVNRISTYSDRLVRNDKEKRLLEEQLNALGLSHAREHVIDNHNLPDFNYYIIVSPKKIQETTTILQDLFGHDRISVDTLSHSETRITLFQCLSVPHQKLATFANHQKNIQQRHQAEMHYLTQATVSPPMPRRRRGQPQSDAKEAKSSETIPPPETVHAIRFGRFGIFKPHEEGPIKELRAPYWPRMTHFGLFSAPQEAFLDPRLHGQYQSAANRGQIVPPRGSTGIVSCNKWITICDEEGRASSFLSRTKVKVIGEDPRVFEGPVIKGEALYANGTVDPSKHPVLHVYDTVDNHSHRSR